MNRMRKMVAALALALATVGMSAGMVSAATGDSTSWTNATFYGISVTAMLLVAGFLLVVTWLMPDVNRRYGKAMKVIAVALVIASIFAVYGVGVSQPATTGTTDAYDWTAVINDNRTNIIWPSQYAATWYVDYNTTSNTIVNSTGSAIFTLNVGRADTLSAWAYDKAAVENIGTFTDPTTGIEYPVVAKGSDGLYEADWTDSSGNTFNMEITLPQSEVKTASANLTVTLNDVAFDGMTVGQGSSFHITFANYDWTITPTLRNIAS